MEIVIDPSVGQQSVARTLELYASGYGESSGLPVNPEGHEPGKSYSATSLEMPDGKTVTYLFYDGELLGQVPVVR